MFLQQLPNALRWPLLFVIGAAIAALTNLAIYRLAIFSKRNVSPWSPPPTPDRPRTMLDRIPIVGWIFLRRESDVYGKRHWLRPMMIELVMAFGLAWFFHWYMAGGLYGGADRKLIAEQADIAASWNFGWFMFHWVLFVLMIVATFIDFDEQMIPDWITIPGTVFAVVCHAIAPTLRLPVRINELLAVRLAPLDFWSPGKPMEWHFEIWGPVTAVAIILVWCFALLPKWTTLRWGVARGCKIMVASVIRPPRKTKGTVPRTTPRKMLVATKVLAVLAVVMVPFILVMFTSVGGVRWTALMDSLLGLAMGGGIVWAVRIIASQALGVEAMGFGDVTLMCMVGAFIGWQGALLAFVIAPFTSIAIALIQLLATGENRLAFGPYLCLGAAIVIVGWDWVWNEWAAKGVFALGGTFLLAMIAACLVMMAIMLGVWSQIKRRFA